MSTTPPPEGTPPPGVIPTTLPPDTTAPPAVIFNDVNVSDVNMSVTHPVEGSGGVADSYENTTGTVVIENVVLDTPFTEEVSYVAYDANGRRDEYGDPIDFISGQAGVVVNDNNESVVEINEELTAVADPTNNSGNMDVVVQLRDSNYTTIVTGQSITNPGPVRVTPAPITTTPAATPAPSPITPAPTPPPVVSRPGDSDTGAVGDTGYIPPATTTSTTEDSETGDAEVQVSSQEELIAAVRAFSQVEIINSFDLTQTIEVPADTSIRGVNKPVIRTNTTAFSIKESNVTLDGVTITKLGSAPIELL